MMEVAVDKLGMLVTEMLLHVALAASLSSVLCLFIQARVLNEQLWLLPVLKLRMLAAPVHETTLQENPSAHAVAMHPVVACRACLVYIIAISVIEIRIRFMVRA